MLELKEIKELIDNPKNKEFLERAEELRKKHELHVSGIGLDDYLNRIQGIENKDAVSLRRALGKVITKPEINKVISVQNKIFSARGGGRFYEFSNDRDKEYFQNTILKNVKEDFSLSEYMRKVWRELVNIDPNGLIFTEISEDGLDVYLTYKASSSILDIDFSSAQTINYIIFQPEIIGNDRIYRVVDKDYDYLIKYNGRNPILIPEQTFTNPFGFVPAVFISDRLDKQSIGFTSHIEESLIYADDMLLDYTIYKVYKTKMGIPYHWQYEHECSTCDGSGEITLENNETGTCSKCQGTGYMNKNRDVAEMLILPMPEEGDVSLNPPAGYVQADLQTWTKFEETIQQEKDSMYAAVWGESSTIETDRRNITAQELTFRDFSKTDKLNEISDNEEIVEKAITDMFGIFYYPNTYKGSVINNGRNFDTKSPSQLMDDYLMGLEKGLSSTELTEIMESYYHSVYNRNPKKLNEANIKLKTKPFFHWQPEKILKTNADRTDYYKNLYYDEFITWFEQNVEEIGYSTIDKVQESLDKWILEKLPKDENTDTDENSGFSQEQLESQANLRGSVGGVQGILAIQASVQAGTTDYNAALSTLKEIYGFDEEKSKAILGKPGINKQDNINQNTEQDENVYQRQEIG